VPQGGSAGQALVKTDGTDYNTEWADIAVDTQYHNRFQTDAETFRSGATDTVELYYTAKADGDGLAESASSDTPTAGKIIKRKIYYSEAAFADPDTGTWVEFTPEPADDASFATVKAALLEYLKARTGGTVPISLKQTWEEVTAAPAFTGLLNETYGSGAEAAYSTRRLNGNVTDCMVIRRASDSTTTTIGFDGEDIDEAAIETFCTGTTCTVSEWKDQSSNGNDATQSDPTKQPTIYTGGALVKEGGKLALDFDGSNDFLSTSDGVANEAELTIFQTSRALGTNGGVQAAWTLPQTSGSHTNPYARLWFMRRGVDDMNVRINGAQTSFNNKYPQNQSLFCLNSKQGFVDVSGTNSVNFTGADITYPNSVPFVIGANGGAFENWEGKNQELILYPSDKSSTDQTSIEENIGDYFTQNTPLLDTYTGAAAAYSLRKLSSSYSGSAVEVYNGSSYADIGFDVFGELNTVALAAHCGSNDGFVSKWYCQSGNSNDAVQTNTANMPKIYDGTTGVVTENGKPAVEFDGTNDELEITRFVYTALTTVAVAKTSAPPAGNAHVLAQGNGFLLKSAQTSTNYPRFQPYDTAYRTAEYQVDSSNTQLLLFGFISGGNANIYVNGTAGTTASVGALNNPTNNIFIGKFSSLSNSGNIGPIQEIIMYDSNQSANRTGIESNIATFYDITI
jgi:hypothetical protein